MPRFGRARWILLGPRWRSAEFRDGSVLEMDDEVEGQGVAGLVDAGHEDLGRRVVADGVGVEGSRADDATDPVAGELAGEGPIWLGRDDELDGCLVVGAEGVDQRQDLRRRGL